MKEIIMKNKNGKLCGLGLDPSKGELLTQNELNKLKPYIECIFEISKKVKYINLVKEKLNVSEGGFCFFDLTQIEKNNLNKILNKIEDICRSELTEKIIVPHSMGREMATIRHRPLYFEANHAEEKINVRYTTLGDFNNFDVAISVLEKIYPGVECEKQDTTGNYKIQNSFY